MSIESGERVEVEISGVAAGGSGVGRIDGLAVFVPHTCRGDRVLITLTRIKSGCAYGELVAVLRPSPYRRTGFCPIEGSCGGCDFAHIEYGEQLFIKRQIVTDALERIGGFSHVTVHDTLAAPRQERYRNKMVFPLGKDQKGRLAGGFFAAGSHQLVPLSDCRQGDLAASSWLEEVLEYLKETGISVYDEHTRRGTARRLFVRLAEGTREAMAVLTVNGDTIKHPELLIKRLLSVKTDYRLTSILLNIHKESNNLLLGKRSLVLYGRDYIVDTLAGLWFHISPHSFYQINPIQTEILYETALSLAGLSETETALDLYCGIGTISLLASQRAARVIGVESVPQAVENARENAARNGILNAEFILGRAEDVAPKLKEAGKTPAVVFLDPPRKGADQAALSTVAEMAPDRIVYISCNPATLARDAKYLNQMGYAIKEAIPVDMFPNTSHVECVVLMSRAN